MVSRGYGRDKRRFGIWIVALSAVLERRDTDALARKNADVTTESPWT